MDKSIDQNNPGLTEKSEKMGYYIKTAMVLREIDVIFYELEHTDTGARYVHISNDDNENTFGVAFKTIPVDSTGVAHILEHTVLCGSREFPVRDPFFSMLKRSLNTFMNAFTASDWTMYPFSSQNKKDFYNLLDVYLDSAFFPKIDELSFKQEGHRVEIEDVLDGTGEQRLVYKGVVYNEMKGAMSSPDQILIRSLQNALYPETTYSFNSGGDPVAIPKLTHAQLKAFHGRHYHPSNAYFYSYGNMPLIEHLGFINNKILKKFDRIDPKTDVPSQSRWKASRKMSYPYPLSKNEDPAKKYQVCMAWLTADIKESFEVLVLSVLEQILLGNPASPLRKALIDSGLGTALSDGTGFDPDNKDTMFACGLKDVKESDGGIIEELIINVLNKLVTEGVDNQLIESAIHQIEFHRKEVTNVPYPYGLRLFLSFTGSWLHGGDPQNNLRFASDIQKLREAFSEKDFLKNRLKKYLLDNPHRVLLTLVPDQHMEQKERQRVAGELKIAMDGMKKTDLINIIKETAALKEKQEEREDISCLPTLDLADIEPAIKSIMASQSYPDVPAACYEQPTSGIFYFSSVAGAGTLPQNLIPLVPFFCHAFSRCGAAGYEYTEMARRIDAHTGGISLGAHARTGFDAAGDCIPFVSLNGKCLASKQARMFDIVQDFMFRYDFTDIDRIKNVLREYIARLESMVLHNGHSLAISLASRNFSKASFLSETWSGIHQLRRIKEIAGDLSTDILESISNDLIMIGKEIFKADNLKIAVIGEHEAILNASSQISSIYDVVSSSATGGFISPEMIIDNEIPRDGWITSSSVSFVASTFKSVRLDHEDAPVLSVISKILRSMYLHREIREKGGAYGGFAIYNSETGLFTFCSYRDPHIVSTLNVYDHASDFIISGEYGDEDIKEAILQVCSEIDKPDPPGAGARKAFYREIVFLSDLARKRFKRKLLSVTLKMVREVAEKYFGTNLNKSAVAVISNDQKLKEANASLSENSLKLYSI